MQGIAITSERLVSVGNTVTDMGALLEKEIAATGQVLAGIRAGWRSDEAAPRYAAALERYLEQAGALKDALVGRGAALVGTGHRFGEAETVLAGEIPAGS